MTVSSVHYVEVADCCVWIDLAICNFGSFFFAVEYAEVADCCVWIVLQRFAVRICSYVDSSRIFYAVAYDLAICNF
jgi:hypothetical protein